MFFADTIDYLVHVIRLGGLEHAERMTEAVEKIEHTATKTKFCLFIGLCSLFWRLISNFACLAAHLNKTITKELTETVRLPA